MGHIPPFLILGWDSGEGLPMPMKNSGLRYDRRCPSRHQGTEAPGVVDSLASDEGRDRGGRQGPSGDEP